MRKLRSRIFGLLPVFVLTAALGGLLYLLSPERDMPFASGIPSGKTDKLLRDLGFQPYPFQESVDGLALKNINGNEIRLSELRGKVVFLNFWTTWCPDCRIEMPSMEKLHARFKNKNFAMFAVNLKEPPEQVQKFFSSHQLTFTGLLDPDGIIASKMAIRALPTTLIIAKNGTVLGMALGSRPWDGKKSIALFEHLVDQ